MVSFSLIMLIIGLSGIVSVAAVAIPASLVIMGEGFIYPNSAALAFNNVKQHMGVATALFGSIQLIACALASALIAFLPETSQVPVATVLLVLSLTLVFCFLGLKEPNSAHISARNRNIVNHQ